MGMAAYQVVDVYELEGYFLLGCLKHLTWLLLDSNSKSFEDQGACLPVFLCVPSGSCACTLVQMSQYIRSVCCDGQNTG